MATALMSDRLVGREKDVNAIRRMVNKGINVVIVHDSGAGGSAVLDAVFEEIANGKHPGRKLAYVRSYGNSRDLQELLFAASYRHGDIFVPEHGEHQSYERHKTGNTAVLERRLLGGVKSSSEPYLIGLDGVERIDRNTLHLFQNLLGTGKVSIVATATKESLKVPSVEELFKTFDPYELKGLNDAKVVELFDYLAEKNGIEISPEDNEEIRRKLPRIAFGKPAAVIEKLSRALKEKKLNKTALLEDYPITTTKYIYYGNASAALLLFALVYKYFMRMTGDPADYILGILLLVFSMGFFRLLRALS